MSDYGQTLNLACDDHGALRLVRRLSGRAKRQVCIDVGHSGADPIEVMDRIAALRRAGCECRMNIDEGSEDTTGDVVRHLLGALSVLERRQTTMRTSKIIRNANARGSNIGRQRAMTEARKVLAARMLRQGKRGPTVFAIIRELDGPSIGQSAYYIWQKAWLERSN